MSDSITPAASDTEAIEVEAIEVVEIEVEATTEATPKTHAEVMEAGYRAWCKAKGKPYTPPDDVEREWSHEPDTPLPPPQAEPAKAGVPKKPRIIKETDVLGCTRCGQYSDVLFEQVLDFGILPGAGDFGDSDLNQKPTVARQFLCATCKERLNAPPDRSKDRQYQAEKALAERPWNRRQEEIAREAAARRAEAEAAARRAEAERRASRARKAAKRDPLQRMLDANKGAF